VNASAPVLAITMGDPAGIGPEIVSRALAHRDVFELCQPVVVGDLRAMQAAVRITRVPLQVRIVERPAGAGRGPGIVDVLDLGNIDIERVGRARVSAEVGRAAYEYVERATRLALDGEVAAVVTAPLNKEALSEAGWVGVGHTELLAQLCGVPEKSVAMMLASQRLRVVHVSTHVPLRRAIELVTTDRIVTTARLAGEAARDIVGHNPRLAIAGLNPHAGEHGLFGTEEQEHIAPAVRRLIEEGWDVAGPIPPDTVFLRAANGEFDAVVAMYHDQGHIPVKLLGFEIDPETGKWEDLSGVNITLGLPIIRTSVDHGTAFDIAGKGIASERSLIEAIEYAELLAANRAARVSREGRGG
jgi:4-phospho-D-threonate 3-dehydrogenase / 4-phospho-D-erythronate 3-dehydrogenase